MKGPGSLFQGLTRSRSALGSSVVMTGLNGLSKALGYGRVVLMAVLFGASAGMDAYYVAVGAVGLLAATFQSSLESAVLPLLAQAEREGRDSDLMASIFRAVILLSLPALLAMGLFARPFVRLFAYHFDAERLRWASVMIVLLLPFGAVTILQGLLTAWSNHRGRYALTSVALGGVNLLYIPLIALLGTIWGVYGIALAQSLSFAAAVGLLWRLCGGLPLRLKGPLPWDLLKKAAADSLLCVGLVGAGSLYSATDRFFASALPAGSVSAISYGAIVFGLPLSFAAQPLLIYLTRSSKTEASGTSAKGQLQAALAIGWGYFVPCGAALAAAALPLVNLVLAYGAFDARAASLTASCLAALAVALPFALCRTVLYRHIQSIGKLRLFVLWSYLSVGFNIALDWYLAPRLGAPGICLATSLIWIVTTLFFLIRLTPDLLLRLAPSAAAQMLLALAWALPVSLFLKGTFLPLAVTALAAAGHLALCQKLGLFAAMPASWRPLDLAGLLLSRVTRLLKRP